MSVRVVIKEFTPDQITHALSKYVVDNAGVKGEARIETIATIHYVINRDTLAVRIEGARVETTIEQEET